MLTKDIVSFEQLGSELLLFRVMQSLSYRSPDKLSILTNIIFAFPRNYVVGTHQKHLGEELLVRRHNIQFHEDVGKKIDIICITKTCLYNTDPVKPHFYIVKLGFTGVYITFLISAQKHRLWVLVRTASPRRF